MTDPQSSSGSERLPWWAYIMMLPFASLGIIAGGYVTTTIVEMGGG